VKELLGDDTFNKPENIVAVVKKEYPEKYALIKKDFADFRFKLILNQLRKQDNLILGEQICKIIKNIWESMLNSPAISLTTNMFTTPSASACVSWTVIPTREPLMICAF